MANYTTFYSDWIPQIIAIAKQSANSILNIYHNHFDIKTKLDNSPVTTADLISHTVIKQSLKELTPALPVLSEEGGIPSFFDRSKWLRYWLIDPLDGTKEFIQRTGEFTVNIALIENQQPVLGVVIAPVLEQCYWAIRGGAAYIQTSNNPPKTIQAQDAIWKNSTRVVLSRYHPEHQREWANLLKKLGDYDLTYCGSALKICMIAAGEADLYPRYGETCEWDTAAGQCILEAAGGAIVDSRGQVLRYNTRDSLINPSFYAVSSSKLINICCG